MAFLPWTQVESGAVGVLVRCMVVEDLMPRYHSIPSYFTVINSGELLTLMSC